MGEVTDSIQEKPSLLAHVEQQCEPIVAELLRLAPLIR